jgi:glycine/serine hydroxymethyltransferase
MENEIDVRKEKDDKALEEIIERLSAIVNNLSFDYDEASKTMASQFACVHRTLQQSTIKLIAEFIRKVSVSNHDLRNEAAIEWAKKVASIDSRFPFI